MSLRPSKSGPLASGAVLACFLLPFVTASCPQVGFSTTLTGVEVALGTTVEDREMGGELVAVLAILCIVGSLVIGLSAMRSAAGTSKDLHMVAASFAGGGAALLVWLRQKITADALREAGGLIQIQFEPGYWIALVAAIAAAVLHFQARSSGADPSPESAE